MAHRDEYHLRADFFHASMIGAGNGNIQFEVSIGNYGNTLDSKARANSRSATRSTSAKKYADCDYYYLPWGSKSTQPCCQVDSRWENINFRLEALNLLEYIHDRLVS